MDLFTLYLELLSLQAEELDIQWFNLDVGLELHGGRQPELLQAYPEVKCVCSPSPPPSQVELSSTLPDFRKS